ncbi:unnamed protein product [Acanthoscelides obtectus]|uniref:Uncharacterized protein n=1 Tax=Acanthoscelides obtectus TaxID=200917 RepID=A0A9P0PSZ3_ACAOB|nr:unnamed protein product [Acanthoscelides obtectus]CAH2017165.1 unnamed protein product [Acanthoscelides obtectus]CAK1658546.1 hypothetical protein AOBTE_LOCUS20973 [Acanthoscelides obtectus]CAK1658567.1 hypothetical protein AOBTE_LOCUS20990 [Acanthoscelides obtectus]
MAKLSIKVFIALLCVTVITEEAVASKICDRPSIFDKKDVIAQYLKCLKSLSAEQRSDDEKLLVENYHPVSHDMQYYVGPNPDLQELYEVLTTYDN